MTTNTDRIQKTIVLSAPPERVWRAIGDSREFGRWFGVALDGPFSPGVRVTGKIVPTEADPEVAAAQQAYAGVPFECTVERVEPGRLLSFRWHPFAVDPSVDYASEPTTLVVFELEPVEHGTRLTITESGFDRVPLARRARAFAANERGWEAQAALVAKYVARSA